MKLRIRANSLRLRLNQREVELLASDGILSEKVAFPGNTALAYSLRSYSGSAAEAFFADGRIEIRVPREPATTWVGSDELGLYYSLATGDEPLKIAIEKDLECIDGPVEEKDPLAFPRELAVKSC